MPCALRVILAALCAALWLAADAPALLALETTATYYHPSLQGSVMANGERYNRWDPEIAACNWYPLGTLLRVTRLGTNTSVYVRVKDRGSRALTLDLSEAAYQGLGRLPEGRIPVAIEVVSPDAPSVPAAAPEPEAPELEDELDPSQTAPVPVPLLGMIPVRA